MEIIIFTYGYLFYIPVNIIIAIFIFTYGLRCKKPYPYYIFSLLFAAYINAAINLVYFPIITTSTSEWGNIGSYIDMSLNFFEMSGKQQIIGNILLTIPIGILFPFISGLKKRFRGFFIIGTSLALELIQLIIIYFMHSVTIFFDIKDVILNFTGGLIGILIFKLLSQIMVKYTLPPIKNKFIEYIDQTCKN